MNTTQPEFGINYNDGIIKQIVLQLRMLHQLASYLYDLKNKIKKINQRVIHTKLRTEFCRWYIYRFTFEKNWTSEGDINSDTACIY